MKKDGKNQKVGDIKKDHHAKGGEVRIEVFTNQSGQGGGVRSCVSWVLVYTGREGNSKKTRRRKCLIRKPIFLITKKVGDFFGEND